MGKDSIIHSGASQAAHDAFVTTLDHLQHMAGQVKDAGLTAKAQLDDNSAASSLAVVNVLDKSTSREV